MPRSEAFSASGTGKGLGIVVEGRGGGRVAIIEPA